MTMKVFCSIDDLERTLGALVVEIASDVYDRQLADDEVTKALPEDRPTAVGITAYPLTEEQFLRMDIEIGRWYSNEELAEKRFSKDRRVNLHDDRPVHVRYE